MGVYIKDMEMPKSCEECVIEGHYENSYGDEYGFFCPFGYKAYTRETRDSGRLDDCPLVPVPPHGRLIDLDETALAQYYDEEHEEWSMKTVTVEDILWEVCENMPPIIIPADKDGEA